MIYKRFQGLLIQQTTLFMCVFQINRLEGQVSRYKTAADNSEKVEDELKAEKRKLQREVKRQTCILLTFKHQQTDCLNVSLPFLSCAQL